jgi:hypothetical protein
MREVPVVFLERDQSIGRNRHPEAPLKSMAFAVTRVAQLHDIF